MYYDNKRYRYKGTNNSTLYAVAAERENFRGMIKISGFFRTNQGD